MQHARFEVDDLVIQCLQPSIGKVVEVAGPIVTVRMDKGDSSRLCTWRDHALRPAATPERKPPVDLYKIKFL